MDRPKPPKQPPRYEEPHEYHLADGDTLEDIKQRAFIGGDDPSILVFELEIDCYGDSVSAYFRTPLVEREEYKSEMADYYLSWDKYVDELRVYDRKLLEENAKKYGFPLDKPVD